MTNSLLVYMTHACNYRCSYCSGVVDFYNGTMKMNYANLFININKLIIYLSQHSEIHQIYLSGGEPTLHPNLKYVCSSLINMKKKVTIITNLSKTAKYYNTLIKIGVNIATSYHTVNTNFLNTLKQLLHVKYIFIMAEINNFNTTYKIYQQLKYNYNNVFFIKIDNQKYSIQQLNIIHNENSIMPFNLNTIPVITSAGNIYANDTMYENGSDKFDSIKNILGKI